MELCDEAGAACVARMLEDYWEERGYGVTVRFLEAGFDVAMRTRRIDVRSDLVNGLPRGAQGIRAGGERRSSGAGDFLPPKDGMRRIRIGGAWTYRPERAA